MTTKLEELEEKTMSMVRHIAVIVGDNGKPMAATCDVIDAAVFAKCVFDEDPLGHVEMVPYVGFEKREG